MVRYTFAVRDLHPLLLAGLPAHPIQFNAPHASISFASRYMALPLRRNDHALRIMRKRATKALLTNVTA